VTPAEYIVEVRRTLSPATTARTLQLGLLGESGEVADLVKKFTAHGKPFDAARLSEELGDVLWYVTAKFDRTLVPTSWHAHLFLQPDYRMGDLEDVAIELCQSCADLGHAEHQIDAVAAARNVLSCVSTMLVEWCNESVADCMERNVAKLRARYPDGFTAQPT
jgi:MazG nucleotide pyrophosphohydrolase domain